MQYTDNEKHPTLHKYFLVEHQGNYLKCVKNGSSLCSAPQPKP